MAAALNWSGQITDDEGHVYGSLVKGEQPAQVVVRGNVMRVMQNGSTLVELGGVQRVSATTATVRTVAVVDDQGNMHEWTVERAKRGCGCR